MLFHNGEKEMNGAIAITVMTTTCITLGIVVNVNSHSLPIKIATELPTIIIKSCEGSTAREFRVSRYKYVVTCSDGREISFKIK